VTTSEFALTKRRGKWGLAGLYGVVHGETTPSLTGVLVIGKVDDDFAINVHFVERGEGFWFASDLVAVVDHAAGTEITLDGVNKKWVRQSDGSWEEVQLTATLTKKKWWKFW